MEMIVVAIVTFAGTALTGWWLHQRETKKEETATEVAVTAMHEHLNARMKGHVDFIEGRLRAEREEFARELENEREECARQINSLAGRLGIAEAKLKRINGAKGLGEDSELL